MRALWAIGMRALWTIFASALSNWLPQQGAAVQFASAIDKPLLAPLLLTEFEQPQLKVKWSRRNEGSDTTRSGSDGRPKYMVDKLAVDRRSLQSLNVEEVLATLQPYADNAPPKDTKVAFLFLLVDGLDWPEVWDHFFMGVKKSRYSIYVHLASNSAHPKDLNLVTRWGAIDVPRAPNSWCALMGVEVALILAALKDPSNTQFVFLSHDTVPLKTFNYIHAELAVKSPDTSKFCLADRSTHHSFINEVVANEIRRRCVYRDFYSDVNPRTPKHHQWVVLARSHAVTVARRALDSLDYWERTWRDAAKDLKNMGEGCSDEAVPLASLLLDFEQRNKSTGDTFKDLEQIGVMQQCLTLVQWHDCFVNTELELPKGEDMSLYEELTFMSKHLHDLMEFLEPGDHDWLQSPLKKLTNEFPHSFTHTTSSYLKTAMQHGFMFARKFPPGLQITTADGKAVPFPEMLPKLWSEVNETMAKNRVWSRTSLSGLPDGALQSKSGRWVLDRAKIDA